MAKSKLSQMIADIVADKMSFFELIRSAPEGDYFAHVQLMCPHHLIMGEPEALKALLAETTQAMCEARVDVDEDAIMKNLARKCQKTMRVSDADWRQAIDATVRFLDP
jgi:hypothetical protein